MHILSQNNIKDLILDLRYNGGGDLNVLHKYWQAILPVQQNSSNTFLKLTYNDKNHDYNSTYNFKTVPYPLELTRLVVITTRSTASASEDVMNGLKPYLDVSKYW